MRYIKENRIMFIVAVIVLAGLTILMNCEVDRITAEKTEQTTSPRTTGPQEPPLLADSSINEVMLSTLIKRMEDMEEMPRMPNGIRPWDRVYKFAVFAQQTETQALTDFKGALITNPGAEFKPFYGFDGPIEIQQIDARIDTTLVIDGYTVASFAGNLTNQEVDRTLEFLRYYLDSLLR